MLAALLALTLATGEATYEKYAAAARAKFTKAAVNCGFANEQIVIDPASDAEYLQVTINGDEAAYGDSAVQCLAVFDAKFAASIDFEDGDADVAFEKYQKAEFAAQDRARAQKYLKTAKLRGKFRPWDGNSDLGDYGRNVERLCGARLGSQLKLFSPNYLETLDMWPDAIFRPAKAGKSGCVWALLTLAELPEHGADFGGLVQVPDVEEKPQ